MNPLLWLAVSSIVWGGVLCLAAMLLQRNSNLSGRMRQWIWRSAMALLIAPWLAAPVVSALGLGLAPAEQVVVAAPVGPVAETPAVEATFDQAGPSVAPIVREDSGWMPQGLSLTETLLLIVMLGWVVRFVFAQLSARTLLGIVANSEIAGDGSARRALEAWSARLKLRRQPELRFASGRVSPFSYGILRPVIVLPEGLEHQLDPKALDLVVGHECLHVARGDGWLRPLERIVADVMWFNPFAWLMRREADVARELAVDEGVVAISDSRRAYARALRDVAGLAVGLPPSLPAASMSLAGSGRSLVLRMQRTLALAKRKPARAAMLAAAVLGAAGACTSVGQAMLATPAVAQSVAPEPEPVAPQQAPTPPSQTPAVREIRAWYPARVVAAEAGQRGGFHVKLQQAADTATHANCELEMNRLVELKVKPGDILNVGDAIGSGAWGRIDFGEFCRRSSGAALNSVFPERAAAQERRFSDGKTSAIRRGGFDPSASGREIRAWYPAKVAVADGDAQTGYKVRLVQTRDTETVHDCTVGLSSMQSLKVKVGQSLAEGDLIGAGAPDNMTFQVMCRESMVRAGSPLLNAFPELRQPQTVQMRTAPPSGPASLGSRGYGAGPIGAPFNARVTKVEKLGDLFAVNIEATGPTVSGDRLGEGCTARLVGLAEVNVAQGATIAEDQTIGRQDAPDDFTIRCKSVGPAGPASSPTGYLPTPPGIKPIPVQLQTPPAPRGAALPPMKGATSPVLKGEAKKLSGFGYRVDPFGGGKAAFHEGADLGQEWGAPIYAPADGTVTFTGVKGTYGRVVEIAMADGYSMHFGHLNSITVEASARVKAGDKVGTMGSTGRSTGAHLHVEVVREGRPYDPELIPGLQLADRIVDAPYQPATPTTPATPIAPTTPTTPTTPSITPPAITPIVMQQQERQRGGRQRREQVPALVITQEGDTDLPPKMLGATHVIVGSPARFTSGFGNRIDPFDASKSGFHTGVDIGKEFGAPIYAPAVAIVLSAGPDPQLGNAVLLDIGGGYTLCFSRLAEIKVKPGETLKAGDILGTMGSSGGPSTGPHLHLETFWNGRAYNPQVVPGLVMIGPA
ncbi:MAG TPA: M23/M56 family metallopeptidase [Hyphomonadaceae bacterium]|jgi:murein DD-endopeptidase MepM/ murein hydrolase activator NlpD/Zn-dependent protease with chaperone function|nr:M23/M56 family metallopeptidase [Hyphomonadaceae bacterium]